MITLYGMGSPNVIKVLILLNELDLDFEFVAVNVLAGEQFEPPLRTLNPNCKVPVLVDARGGGKARVVFESGAILMYLAEQEGRFWPSDLAERYHVIEWLMFQMASLGPMAGQAIHFSRVARSDGYGTARFTTELTRLCRLIEVRLGETHYIAGDTYSIADMALYPWLHLLPRFFPDLVDGPNTKRWLSELSDRPAIAAANAKAEVLSAEFSVMMKQATPEQIDRYFGRASEAASR